MDLREYRNQRIRSEVKGAALRWSIIGTLGLAVIWGSFWIPWLRTAGISADDYASQSEIESAVMPYLASLNAFWLPNNNYFLLKTAELERLLKEKGVGLAAVKKAFPATVRIDFPRSEPWLIYCSTSEVPAKDGPCFYVSETGILSDRAPRFSVNPLPAVITGNAGGRLGEAAIPREDAHYLKEIFRKLRLQKITATLVSMEGGGEIKIMTNEKWYLRVSGNSEMEKIMGDLKLLLSEKIKDDRARLEYIDMRFPDKAFYKLR